MRTTLLLFACLFGLAATLLPTAQAAGVQSSIVLLGTGDPGCKPACLASADAFTGFVPCSAIGLAPTPPNAAMDAACAQLVRSSCDSSNGVCPPTLLVPCIDISWEP